MDSSQKMSALVMTPNSLHGDSTELRSDSSAACYENYEPFETFQHKVAAATSKHSQLSISKIKIEHMKGGSNNRVAAVTFTRQPSLFSLAWFRSWFLDQPVETSALENYIVRVPRFTDPPNGFSVDRDVAILKTVRALLDLPIPEVAAYDLTVNNPFGKPYIIQPRLPGQNLSRLWNSKTLNLEQMKSIVRQVTQLAETIATVEGPGGNISLKALSSESPQLHVESLHLEHKALGDTSYTFPDPLPDTIEHLLKVCQRWSQFHRAKGAPFDEIWYNFGRIIKSLYARDFIDGPCVLAHRDLESYNLLAEVRSETEVVITGVIDWDSAAIAPEFVAYRAPYWIWTDYKLPSDICYQEETANLPPATEQAEILKQVFLENASEKYKLFAFAPEAILARRMYVILKEGICTDWHIMESWSIVRDWIKLHPEDNLPFDDPELKLGLRKKPVPDCDSVSDSDSSIMSDNSDQDNDQS